MFTHPDGAAVQEYGTRLVPLGVTMLLETYDGYERADDFFEVYWNDMSS